MKNKNLETILAIAKQWLYEHYQDALDTLVLYGSQARGDAKEDSDIDILIVLNRTFDYREEINRTSEFIADLSLEYETVISRAFVSAERYKQENSAFFLNVRREGIIV
ncbi:nucleotidyltransferase domain-containing protein [Roseofilum sp. BLCC_M91]|uniref:Nucleotidyltransferase domain-containing protein n=1 Tax=Roseofilum halophilum BLCC-M91 TaxID=3022259 RepID=A0ABT7BFD9_9CYAN|nr:nucleotidyltransferase domain-containing protein [Roseofilum halophilum]MDJ1177894.1 nucleotidyltransferase domain-containing protein [Roseofilum halophilum BLCC-M91]